MRKITHKEFLERLEAENPNIYKKIISFLSEFNGYREYVFVETIWGALKVLPESLLESKDLPISSAIDKADFWVRRSKDLRQDSDNIDYSEANYKNNSNKVKLRCKEHDYTYNQRPSHHTANVQGCVYCMKQTVQYTEDNFKAHEEFFKDHKGCLYVVNLHSESESFYKVGVTAKDNFKSRISRLKGHYNVDLLYKEEGLTKDLYKVEQLFLKEFEGYKYTPNIKIKGHTECLTTNPIPHYYKWLQNMTRHEESIY